MNTMNRCFKPPVPHLKPSTTARRSALAATATALCALLAAAPVTPAFAQQNQTLEHAVARNFPPSSQRGELIIKSTVEGSADGKDYRLAPGLRIFNQQNQLVFAHAVIGKKLDVRYLVEPSTGMLLTAWILTQTEVAREPKRSWLK